MTAIELVSSFASGVDMENSNAQQEECRFAVSVSNINIKILERENDAESVIGCALMKSGFSGVLVEHYSDDERKIFQEYLDDKVLPSLRHIEEEATPFKIDGIIGLHDTSVMWVYFYKNTDAIEFFKMVSSLPKRTAFVNLRYLPNHDSIREIVGKYSMREIKSEYGEFLFYRCTDMTAGELAMIDILTS